MTKKGENRETKRCERCKWEVKERLKRWKEKQVKQKGHEILHVLKGICRNG